MCTDITMRNLENRSTRPWAEIRKPVGSVCGNTPTIGNVPSPTGWGRGGEDGNLGTCYSPKTFRATITADIDFGHPQ